MKPMSSEEDDFYEPVLPRGRVYPHTTPHEWGPPRPNSSRLDPLTGKRAPEPLLRNFEVVRDEMVLAAKKAGIPKRRWSPTGKSILPRQREDALADGIPGAVYDRWQRVRTPSGNYRPAFGRAFVPIAEALDLWSMSDVPDPYRALDADKGDAPPIEAYSGTVLWEIAENGSDDLWDAFAHPDDPAVHAREAAKALGSQAELARLVGVTRQVVSLWIKGDQRPEQVGHRAFLTMHYIWGQLLRWLAAELEADDAGRRFQLPPEHLAEVRYRVRNGFKNSCYWTFDNLVELLQALHELGVHGHEIYNRAR